MKDTDCLCTETVKGSIMLMSESLEKRFSAQIGAEFFSFYSYLQISAYFERTNLPGCARWMRLQADEEQLHAMKFWDYVMARGNTVILPPIDSPETDFASPLSAFERALEHERSVSRSIHDLYGHATRENDYASFALLQWFVAEQVEEENTVVQIIEQLRMVGDDGPALLILDKELGSRTAEE